MWAYNGLHYRSNGHPFPNHQGLQNSLERASLIVHAQYPTYWLLYYWFQQNYLGWILKYLFQYHLWVFPQVRFKIKSGIRLASFIGIGIRISKFETKVNLSSAIDPLESNPGVDSEKRLGFPEQLMISVAFLFELMLIIPSKVWLHGATWFWSIGNWFF